MDFRDFQHIDSAKPTIIISDHNRMLDTVHQLQQSLIGEGIIDSSGLHNRRRPAQMAGSPIHKAFCKTNAPSDDEIECYLDKDKTEENDPEVILVRCNISCGINLDQASRRLFIGDELSVRKDGDEWICEEGFQASQDYTP